MYITHRIRSSKHIDAKKGIDGEGKQRNPRGVEKMPTRRLSQLLGNIRFERKKITRASVGTLE